MINTDIAIIGAGPTGLFTVFEAGLLKLHCHLIDSLPNVGGQLIEIYPKKPIYDIPGLPAILAGDLIHNLIEQIKPFHPTFTLGERVEEVAKNPITNKWIVKTNKGTEVCASVIVIAGGLGSFEPRKPSIHNLHLFEDRGVEYMVKEPELFRNKKLVISGGGDSALDWTIFLADVANHITLVHRRKEFRGAVDSVEKVKKLVKQRKIDLFTDSEIIDLNGNGSLQSLVLKHDETGLHHIDTDFFVPLFGLSPKLGPISDWGLQIDRNDIAVDTFDYATNVHGIFAIGDINTYPGKLKLILCGFHEATLMVQSAFKIINPTKKLSFKYTTVTGIQELL